MKMKSIYKKVFSLFMVFAILCTMFVASAVTTSAATSGGSGSATVVVKSKSNYWYPGASSVTLRQEKQTLTYQALFSSKTKTKTGYYGCYNITVYNVTKNISKNIQWSGGQTKKISLDPNCTYRITVKYDSKATDIFTSSPFGYSWKRTSSPYWRVKSTWKVSSYY